MRTIAALVLSLGICLTSCQFGARGEYYTIQGFTQGTSYRITYQHPTEYDIKDRIDSALRAFDLSLSAYDSASILSAINRNQEKVETDTLFRTVFREAARVYQLTGGAFDIVARCTEQI